MLVVLACCGSDYSFSLYHLYFSLRYSLNKVGFINTTDISTNFTGLQCSLSMFTDDVLNGNVTDAGTQFFTGLSKLSSSIASLDTNLGNLKGNMSLFGQNASGIGLAAKTSIDSVTSVRTSQAAVIDDGFNPVYTTPVTSASPGTGIFISTFKALLGT